MLYYYRARIEYNGARYCGWQVQPNLQSVQSTLLKIIIKLCGGNSNLENKIKVVGSSRTDAGVHALDQVVSLVIPKKFEVQKLFSSLNSMLAEDIKILELEECQEDFHPIKFVKKKQYLYFFQEEKYISVFTRPYVFPVKYKLNTSLMKSAAEVYLGTHDFAYYRSEGTINKTTIRTIYEATAYPLMTNPFFSLVHSPGMIVFSITANGFLRQMVRAMAGVILGVGRGSISLDQVKSTIDLAGDHKQLAKLAPVLPGNSLFLYSSWPKFYS